MELPNQIKRVKIMRLTISWPAFSGWKRAFGRTETAGSTEYHGDRRSRHLLRAITTWSPAPTSAAHRRTGADRGGTFAARSFEDLFNQVGQLPWEEFIGRAMRLR